MSYSTLCALGLDTTLDNEAKYLKKTQFIYSICILGLGVVTALLCRTLYFAGKSQIGFWAGLYYCFAGILFFGTLTYLYLFIRTFFLFRKDLKKIKFIRESENEFRNPHVFDSFRRYQMSTILRCVADHLNYPKVTVDSVELPIFFKDKDEDRLTTSTIWQTILLKSPLATNAIVRDYENSRTIGIYIAEDSDTRIILINEDDEVSELFLSHEEELGYPLLIYQFFISQDSEHTSYDFSSHQDDDESIIEYLKNDFHFIPS